MRAIFQKGDVAQMERIEALKRIFRLNRFLPVSLGAVLVALLVRILQLNLTVDFSTGFYTQNTLLVPLLGIILILYFVYAAVVLTFSPVRLEHPYKLRNTVPAAVIFAFSGILLAVEGLILLFGRDGTLERFTAFLEAVSGVTVLYHAGLVWKREQRRLQNHIFFLVPAVWSVFDLVRVFVRHTTVANISAYIFEILFSAFLTLFLLYYARFTAGLLRPGQKRLLAATSVLTAMLGAVTSIPPLFCRLTEYDGIGRLVPLPDFSVLAFAVISGLMLFLSVRETLAPASSVGGSAHDCEYGCETVGVEGLFPVKHLWKR